MAALAPAGWPLFMQPEQKWYRTGEVETGVHQFLVQDPDGYLIRFSAYMGDRYYVASATTPNLAAASRPGILTLSGFPT